MSRTEEEWNRIIDGVCDRFRQSVADIRRQHGDCTININFADVEEITETSLTDGYKKFRPTGEVTISTEKPKKVRPLR